jgi:hypothetical protein
MSNPILSPRIAKDKSWQVYANCEKCRLLKRLDIDALFRGSPDLDLGEALAKGRLRCIKCEQPGESISVSRMHVGLVKSVMSLTRGLNIVRNEEDE